MGGGSAAEGPVRIGEIGFITTRPIELRPRTNEIRPLEERPWDAARRLDYRSLDVLDRPLETLRDRLFDRIEEFRQSFPEIFKELKKFELDQRIYDQAIGLRATLSDLRVEVINHLPPSFNPSVLLQAEIRDLSILELPTLPTFRALAAEKLAEIKGSAVQLEGTQVSIPFPQKNGVPQQALVLTLDGVGVRFNTTELTNWVPELVSVLELNKQIFNDPTYAALNQEAFEIDLHRVHTEKSGYTLAVGVVNSMGGRGLKEYFGRLSEAFKPLGAEIYVLENGRVAVLAPEVTSQKISEVFEKINNDLRAVRSCQDLDSGFVLLEVQDSQEVSEKPLEMVDRLSRAARQVEINRGEVRPAKREVIATETDLTYDREVMEDLGLSSRPETEQTPKVGTEIPGFWEEDASPPKGQENTNVQFPGVLTYDEDAPTGVFPRDISQQVQIKINSAQTSGKPEVVKGQRGHRIELIPITGRNDIPPQLLQARAEMSPVVKALLQKKSNEETVILRAEEREGRQQRQQPGQDGRRENEEAKKFWKEERAKWKNILNNVDPHYAEVRREIEKICGRLRMYVRIQDLTAKQRVEISDRLRVVYWDHDHPEKKAKIIVDNRSLEDQFNLIPLPSQPPIEVSKEVADYFIHILKGKRIEHKTLDILSQAA